MFVYSNVEVTYSVTRASGIMSGMSTTFAARRSANRRRRTEARQQILDAARTELRTTAFRDLSVEQLMKATGLTRTAFYRYFPDREAVLVELLEEILSVLAEGREADGEGIEEGWLEELGSLLADNREVLKAIADAAPGDEDVERAYRAFMHEYWIDDLVGRIADAQLQGLAPGLDAELAGEALGWMAERMVTQTQTHDPQAVLDTIVAIVVRCIYAGAPASRPAPRAGGGADMGVEGAPTVGEGQQAEGQQAEGQQARGAAAGGAAAGRAAGG